MVESSALVRKLLDSSSESRVITWQEPKWRLQEPERFEWIERVLKNRQWRDVVIPEEDVLVEWLIWIPKEAIARAFPAILYFTCTLDPHLALTRFDVAFEYLRVMHENQVPPLDWNYDVICATDVYLKNILTAELELELITSPFIHTQIINWMTGRQ